MKNILDFILKIGELKKMKRSGWVLRGVKNPETIAQHKFRVALMNWLLAETAEIPLNIERIIKISLAHDLCEVYAGDLTPYRDLLPDDHKKRKEILKRWVRLPKEVKEERARAKYLLERASLEKLVRELPLTIQKEIFNSWLDYEKMQTREGKFVRQGDKVETLLQAIEYFGTKKDSFALAWWEEVEDLVEEEALLKFLHSLERVLYKKQGKDPLLDFIMEVGRLKSMPRRGWVMRGIKKAETIADHSFWVAVIFWVLGKERNLNLERGLKMALIHEICAVYAGDYTPHDIFGKGFLRWRSWKTRPRLELSEKQKKFLVAYEKETEALQKLIEKLPSPLKQEILWLWTDFVEKKSPEADFLDQVNCLATFFQALEYWHQNKNFDIKTFIEAVLEFVHDPFLLELFNEVPNRINLTATEKKSFLDFIKGFAGRILVRK
jgi:putative hydrolase of HD superfamily